MPTTIGKTYYTEYSDYSDYTKDNITENELIYKEESIRYKWYFEEKVGLGYYTDIDNLNNNEYVDYNDWIYGEFSSWTDIIPLDKEGRILEEKIAYKYAFMEKIRYIHFSNLQGSNGYIRFPEIEVYENNNKLKYTVYCEKCNDDFPMYIANNIYNENYSYVENGGYFRIDLGDYFYPNDIKIKLYLYDTGGVPKTYKITLTKNEILDEELLSKEFTDYRAVNTLDNVMLNEIGANDLNIVNGKFESFSETDKYIKPTKTLLVTEVKKYRFKDMMYNIYTYIKTYAEDYHEYLDNYTKDPNNFITLYRYKYRDKIIVPENILIDTYEFNLDEYIDSTDEYKIVGDFDIYKNNNYEMKIIFKELQIPFNLQVQITENEITHEVDNDDINENIEENKSSNEKETIEDDIKKGKITEDIYNDNLNIILENEKITDDILLDDFSAIEKNVFLENKQTNIIEDIKENIENENKQNIKYDEYLNHNNQNIIIKEKNDKPNNTNNENKHNRKIKLSLIFIAVTSTIFLNKRSN
ncbi:MAG TPA: hypothetical protein GX747_01385 [Tenericutes bacterium]|nr:hypothetical protein [Mycoplasmatota bacterium]